MKKSFDDFVRPVQERKNESLSPQKPGNEKAKDHPWSTERQENGISANDFRFRHDTKDEENIPVQRETWEELRHAPSEKPW